MNVLDGEQPDLIVIGGGVAGLYAALCAAADRDVLLLSKGPVFSSNSYYAQGGVAAAIGEGDDPSLHAIDTARAGRGVCRESAVRALTVEAPARIADLVELGVEFDEGLAQEGGHSRRRVVHAGGAETGKAIAQTLAARARAHPRITIVEGERAVALWKSDGRCVGVITDHRRNPGSGDADCDWWVRGTLGADDESSRRGRRRARARVSRWRRARRPRVRSVPSDGACRRRLLAVRSAARGRRVARGRRRRSVHRRVGATRCRRLVRSPSVGPSGSTCAGSSGVASRA